MSRMHPLRILLGFVACLLASPAAPALAQLDTAWIQDFESGWSGWYASDTVWEVGSPSSGPGAAFGGDSCAATFLAGDYPWYVTTQLYSPPFTVPAAGENPRLRFWHWFATSNGGDYGSVWIFGEDSTWVEVGSTHSYSSGRWTRPLIDLSVYAGQVVQLRFRFRDNGDSYRSAGWYVDDIALETGPYEDLAVALEGFEDGLGDWGVTDGTWQVGTPDSLVGPGAAYTGQQCAATILDDNYTWYCSSALVSAPFLVPAAGENPRLRYWHWFATANNGDYGAVWIFGEDSTWVEVGSRHYYSSTRWTRPRIDLSAYAGQVVQVRFHFRDNGDAYRSAGWYIDDITIETGPYEDLAATPETFEDGLGDWGVTRGTWQVGVPDSLVGPGTAYTGQQCATTILDNTYPFSCASALESAPFQVPAAGENPRLRYWHWFATANNGDYGAVWIFGEDSTWVEVGSRHYYSSTRWTRPRIDLSAYAGQVVQIRFHFRDNGDSYRSAGWYIDDITIETGPYEDLAATPETFEDGLGDWGVTRGTWQVGVPDSLVGPGTAYTGQQCAATILDGDYPWVSSSALVSAPFLVPAAGENPRLRYWHWFATANNGDYGAVWIFGEDSTWVEIGSRHYYSSSRWTRPRIDLSPWAGQVVQIRFHFRDNGDAYRSAGWYIDDITIETGPYEDLAVTPETFEDGLGDWGVTRGTWQVGIPDSLVGPGAAYSGQQCAATILDNTYPYVSASALVSAPFQVPSAGENPRLRYWHWFATANNGDYGTVGIFGEDSTWVAIGSSHYYSSGVWTKPRVDLTPWAGQVVQIRFYFVDNGDSYRSAGWYIDDITIETGPYEDLAVAPETFEDGLGDWGATRGTWQVGVPDSLVGPGAAYSGQQCAATILDNTYPYVSASALVSAPFQVPSIEENPGLRIHHWYATANSADFGSVWVYGEDSTWTEVSEHYSASSGGWLSSRIDLNPYAEQMVQVRFYFTDHGDGYYGAGWYIDDIAVETSAPTVYCPGDSMAVSTCALGRQVCIDVPIDGWTGVTTSLGSWANDTLCFSAPVEGPYLFTIIATNNAGADTCQLTVHVSEDVPMVPGNDQFAFSMAQGDTLPSPHTLTLDSPCDPGLLAWELELLDDGGWLQVDKTGGTSPDSVLLSVKDSTLPAGIYDALIALTNLSNNDPPLLINAGLFVAPGTDVATVRTDPGAQVAVPMTINTNNHDATDSVTGFTIPLKYASIQLDRVVADSVRFQDYLVDSFFDNVQIVIDSNAGVIIVNRPIDDPPMPDSEYNVDIYFTIDSAALAEAVTIDTTTFGGAEYQFVQNTGDTVVPSFNAGAILIGIDPPGACPVIATGDVNTSSAIDAADVIAMVNYVFRDGPPPQPCPGAGDVNCDAAANAADIIYLVNYAFKAGPAPCDACTLIPDTWPCP